MSRKVDECKPLPPDPSGRNAFDAAERLGGVVQVEPSCNLLLTAPGFSA